MGDTLGVGGCTRDRGDNGNRFEDPGNGWGGAHWEWVVRALGIGGHMGSALFSLPTDPGTQS